MVLALSVIKCGLDLVDGVRRVVHGTPYTWSCFVIDDQTVGIVVSTIAQTMGIAM